MTNYCVEDLLKMRSLLLKLEDRDYTHASHLLSGATIGQHIRHILEFYSCLLHIGDDLSVNYDERKRDKDTECHRTVAIHQIDQLVIELGRISEDYPLILKGNYSSDPQTRTSTVDSSLFRELAYNLEHSIHHQALIKITLKERELDHLINERFGVAPATIRFTELQQA